MKCVKNLKSFITAVITLFLGIVCLGIVISQGMETRFLIAGIILLSWSAVSFFSAFTQKTIDKQAEKITDERDKYIIMKSSRKTLVITNYLITAACLINVFLFAVLKWEVFLTITITLCAVLFVILFVTLACSIYYEKNE